MDDDERTLGDELEDSASRIEDTARKGVDAYQKYNENKNSRENRQERDSREDLSPSSDSQSDRLDDKDEADTNRRNELQDRKSEAETPQGQEAAQQAAKQSANEVGSEAVKESEKQVTEEAAKAVAKEAAEATAESAATSATGTAVGTALAPGVGTLIGMGFDIIVKTAKYLFVTLLIFVIFVSMFVAMFPTLITKALVAEVATMVVDETFGQYIGQYLFDDWDAMPDNLKKDIAKKFADGFVGSLENQIANGIGNIWYGGYSICQYLDDMTDDDTWVGKIVNSWANGCYENYVEIKIDELQDKNLDAQSITSIMVMDRLRQSYTDTMSQPGTNQLQLLADVQNKTVADALNNKYGTAWTGMDSYDQYKDYPKMWFAILGNYQDIDYLPTQNIPIEITNEKDYVYIDGELAGTIQTYTGSDGKQHKKQVLPDMILYNPYGNKRSSLSISMGSEYEMICHAAYIISMYSVCTPYEQQSIADLCVKLNDAINKAKEDGRNLVEYQGKLSDVYYGCIVPRLYQPYLYKNETDQSYKIGTKIPGYFGPSNTENRNVLGMGPAMDIDANYSLIASEGWFDTDFNLKYSSDERFPLLLQTYNGGELQPFYPDSFCVIATDKRYCNINADINCVQTGDINAPANEGYRIYGCREATEYKTLPYANTNWQEDLVRQIKFQKNCLNTLLANNPNDEEIRKLVEKYPMRYKFPFARISYVMDEEQVYKECVPITGIKSGGSEYTLLKNMSYEAEDGTIKMMNGGKLDGSEAWVYLNSTQRKTISENLKAAQKAQIERNDPIIFKNTIENWSTTDDVTTKIWEKVGQPDYCEEFIYNAKIRYMVSVDITGTAKYFDKVREYFGYNPNGPVNIGLTYTLTEKDSRGKLIQTEKELPADLGPNGELTQANLVAVTQEMYMELMGLKPEVIQAASPSVGTEPQYDYAEMLKIVRAARNADGTPATRNQKYLVYIGVCAAGHIMYDFGERQDPGLDFQKWMTPVSDPDPKTKDSVPDYEYLGTDCSGFVSWMYATAFVGKTSFPYFDTRAALHVTAKPGFSATTASVREGKATASSGYGSVFWDSSKLKTGDVAIRQSYTDGVYGGHATMYIGPDPNNPSQQRWIEMTRWVSTDKTQKVNGVRVFTVEDYGVKKNAVYITFANTYPLNPAYGELPWTVISPVYMLIPQEGEV